MPLALDDGHGHSFHSSEVGRRELLQHGERNQIHIRPFGNYFLDLEFAGWGHEIFLDLDLGSV